VSAALLTGFLLIFLGAAVAAAAPAAAVDDPTRPGARVTHGPSCRPGGLVVEVVAGTAPYSVRLATTRQPAGEDEATLQPGESVVLRTGDVDWGETIDGRLEYTARDGSGVAYVDELEEYSFTRPTREDCAAVAAPSDPEPTPPTSPSRTPAPSNGPDGNAGGGQVPGPTGQPSPTSTSSGEPGAAAPSGPAGPADGGGGSGARQVTAGEIVTLQASGFLPGERVTIQLHGTGAVLGSATAGPDGTVQTEIRIPGRTAAGPATVDMVGDDSAVVADVALQVAGLETAVTGRGTADLVPLTVAAVTLVATVGGLVSVAGRQRATGQRRSRIRSA
jgi:hypothetical protein